jgi:hypothetical protein
MRLVLAAALCAACLLPTAASAANVGSPAECARRHKQVAHFEGQLDRAEALDSAIWKERIGHHLDALKAMQAQRCPDDVEDEGAKAAAEAFAQMLKLAGKAALTYFTFGAF